MKKNNPLDHCPLWTAIITPMQADGKIDYPSFEKLLRKQAAVKNGIVLFGSTGEGMALSRKEKEEGLRFAQGLKLGLPMIVGVPGHQLEEALDWIQFAQNHGADGFLAVTPYYSKPGKLGQINWFKQILDHARLPVMLYNVPSRAGVSLHAEVLETLSAHPNLWALKESSGSIAELKNFQRVNPELSYFCGDDGLLPEFAAQGVKGLISVAANVWPEATRKYAELCLQQKTAGLLPLWKTCTDALFLASNPIPAKWLHHHLGEIPTAFTRAPLAEADFTVSAGATEKLISAHQQIKAWLAERKAQ
jgi:4-hydroxy-tetrahydrodipicolinate synthase